MLLAGLSTGHTIGLSVVAAIFVGFALVSSFVVPRRFPDFPGENGIGVFAIVCVVLFAAQLTAVIVFGVEKDEKPAAHATSAQARQAHTIRAQQNERLLLARGITGTFALTVQRVGK